MATQINKPIPTFKDIDGQPLENGKIYIGSAGLDPATNAITVYSDASLSTAVSQPISTTAGLPYVSGSPVRLYVAETDFSLRVSNTNNTTVHEDLNAGANQLNLGNIVQDSSGNVGISTTSPDERLDLEDGHITLGSSAFAGRYKLKRPSDGAAETAYFGYNSSGSNDLDIYQSSGGASVRLFTAGTERARIDSSGNVGIGTSSPRDKLDVTDGNAVLTEAFGLRWEDAGGTLKGLISTDSGGAMRISTGSSGVSEAMRLDSSGRVGIGENSPQVNLHIKDSTSNCGLILQSENSSVAALTFGRLNDQSRGSIVYDNSSELLYFTGNNLAVRLRIDSAGLVTPGSDNSQSLGSPSLRWSVVYAATGSINTSDARAKTEVSIDDRVLAAVNSINVKAFKWNNSIEEKGDGARIHYGVIAQEVKAAFEAQGLVAEDYGVLCYDEWDDQYDKKVITKGKAAVLDEDGNEIEPAVEEVVEEVLTVKAGNRYGVRYDELYAMKIAALEARITALES